MAPRRITSLTALLIFIALAVTSIFTYLAPRGPGSSDWTALGITKHKWMALHTDLGIIFLVACVVHILYNIKPIAAYLKDQLGKVKVFNANFNIAIVITLWAIISSLFSLPPFGAIQDFKEDRGNRGRHHGREPAAVQTDPEESKEPLPPKPPLFYSGRSLNRLAGKYDIDIPKVYAELKAIGIEAPPDWTFRQIAEQNDMETKSVYEAVLQVQ
ncbi:DUF4405 domain-containing protein [Pontiellaceae bacterium B12227]|nr:DUF4405 domain-containing protein [Pontiellaceae bacterium B12227]